MGSGWKGCESGERQKGKLEEFPQSKFFLLENPIFYAPSLSFENLEILCWFLQVVFTGLANISF